MVGKRLWRLIRTALALRFGRSVLSGSPSEEGSDWVGPAPHLIEKITRWVESLIA
jgi:hypothetical protein